MGEIIQPFIAARANSSGGFISALAVIGLATCMNNPIPEYSIGIEPSERFRNWSGAQPWEDKLRNAVVIDSSLTSEKQTLDFLLSLSGQQERIPIEFDSVFQKNFWDLLA